MCKKSMFTGTFGLSLASPLKPGTKLVGHWKMTFFTSGCVPLVHGLDPERKSPNCTFESTELNWRRSARQSLHSMLTLAVTRKPVSEGPPSMKGILPALQSMTLPRQYAPTMWRKSSMRSTLLSYGLVVFWRLAALRGSPGRRPWSRSGSRAQACWDVKNTHLNAANDSGAPAIFSDLASSHQPIFWYAVFARTLPDLFPTSSSALANAFRISSTSRRGFFRATIA